MFLRLLALFIAIPLLDLILLLWLANVVSWSFTILLIIVSGILGAWMASWQSRSVKTKIEQRLQSNRLPTGSLISDGAIVFFAAGLLITPGLITDVFGFTLLIPPIREGYKSILKKWFADRIQFQSVVVQPFSQFGENQHDGDDILEGEVVRDSTNDKSAELPRNIEKSPNDDDLF